MSDNKNERACFVGGLIMLSVIGMIIIATIILGLVFRK